jgi:2-keto-4-pentenoate hydratase/2-oxohepta-3-ene-1,7-dioic acid hydratase in catechol pathway
MKLVTFEPPDAIFGPLLGLLLGDRVADLNLWTQERLGDSGLRERDVRAVASYLAPGDMLTFLERGAEAMTAARETLAYLDVERGGHHFESFTWSLADIRLRAPLPRPNTIRDFITFEQHFKTSAERIGQPANPLWYELPVYYKGNPNTVVGPEDDIVWPRFTEKLDYELELGMVIGKQGKDVPEEDAPAYIAGYTIFNDVSARDIQAREMSLLLGPGKGKDFDTSNVIGPCLVTPDEFDPSSARMVARVNGEVWSDGVAGAMYHSFARLIAHVSMSETIYPGDFFGSGTVGGGCGLELDRWIKPGDVIELEVEGIGVLRNRVVRP